MPVCANPEQGGKSAVHHNFPRGTRNNFYKGSGFGSLWHLKRNWFEFCFTVDTVNN